MKSSDAELIIVLKWSCIHSIDNEGYRPDSRLPSRRLYLLNIKSPNKLELIQNRLSRLMGLALPIVSYRYQAFGMRGAVDYLHRNTSRE